jgi:hypothetical protein
MADDKFTVGAPYVRQVTEPHFERDAAGAYAKEVELPGFLELVVDVNGSAEGSVGSTTPPSREVAAEGSGHSARGGRLRLV